MFAFQYCGHIYYRAFQDIPATTELLVWYDDKYPQYMGIPLEICETSPRKPLGKTLLRGGDSRFFYFILLYLTSTMPINQSQTPEVT